MQKKCPTTLVKDQKQSSINNFLTFHCTMHNQDKPPNQHSQDPSSNIEIHFSVKVSKSTIKTGKVNIGATAKVLLSVLSTSLLSTHTLNGRNFLHSLDVFVQPPAEELQIHKEIPK